MSRLILAAVLVIIFAYGAVNVIPHAAEQEIPDDSELENGSLAEEHNDDVETFAEEGNAIIGVGGSTLGFALGALGLLVLISRVI